MEKGSEVEFFFSLLVAKLTSFQFFTCKQTPKKESCESVDFVNFLYVVDDVYDDDDVEHFFLSVSIN